MRISDWSSYVCSSDLGRAPSNDAAGNDETARRGDAVGIAAGAWPAGRLEDGVDGHASRARHSGGHATGRAVSRSISTCLSVTAKRGAAATVTVAVSTTEAPPTSPCPTAITRVQPNRHGSATAAGGSTDG